MKVVVAFDVVDTHAAAAGRFELREKLAVALQENPLVAHEQIKKISRQHDGVPGPRAIPQEGSAASGKAGPRVPEIWVSETA